MNGCAAYKGQKVRKEQTDGKTKKDVESTATAADNEDDVEEIPEEIPDDDSVDNTETVS